MVSVQSSMNFDNFTNFLSSGAFVRWQSQWYLFWNLSERQDLSSDQANHGSFSDGVYACDYVSGQISHYGFKNRSVLSTTELKNLLMVVRAEIQSQFSVADLDFKPEWSSIDIDAFAASVEHIQSAISQGQIKKAVPLCFQYGKLQQKSGVHWLHKINFLFNLLGSSENLIPYGQWSLDQGFMGITPELFFYQKGDKLQTMALAGTSAKDLAPADFLADAKERSEHDFVVQDIKEKLSAFGECHFSPTYVLELPFLNHLKTDIQLSLKEGANLAELIQKMHPTSALGVYPKNEYWNEFIRLPYQAGRGTFGAPWGFSTGEESLFVVSIRRLEWNAQQVRIGAGCGIVEQSVLEKEIAEIERKINSVKKVFISTPPSRENVIHE